MSASNSTSDNGRDTIVLQETEVLPKAPESMQTGWSSLVPMVLIFAVFYFLLIRPQDKKRRAQEELVSSIKKGEGVITHSGIYGIVNKLHDSDGTAEITIAPDVTVKILKSAIANITSRTSAVKEVPNQSKSDNNDKKEKKKPSKK